MKKINILIVLFVFGAIFAQVGCSDDDTPPPPPPKNDTKDTTDKDTTPAEINFKVTLGVKTFEVETLATSVANYESNNDETVVYITGSDVKDNTPIVFELKFKGNEEGTFVFPNLNVQLTEGNPGTITFREYVGDPNASQKFTVNITKYGAVGEYIEGTFSGNLLRNLNPTPTRNGYFKVKRGEDF
jgi:hypothetical protein